MIFGQGGDCIQDSKCSFFSPEILVLLQLFFREKHIIL